MDPRRSGVRPAHGAHHRERRHPDRGARHDVARWRELGGRPAAHLRTPVATRPDLTTPGMRGAGRRGARGGDRTHTPPERPGGLSPLRLPVTPPGPGPRGYGVAHPFVATLAAPPGWVAVTT